MLPGGAVPALGTLAGQPQPGAVVAERGVVPVAHAPHGRGGRLGRDRLERKAREVQPAVHHTVRVRAARPRLVRVRVTRTYSTEAQGRTCQHSVRPTRRHRRGGELLRRHGGPDEAQEQRRAEEPARARCRPPRTAELTRAAAGRQLRCRGPRLARASQDSRRENFGPSALLLPSAVVCARHTRLQKMSTVRAITPLGSDACP
eukprot:scaffold33839_cov58-Phaeocystis_antarctica.AAC.2